MTSRDQTEGVFGYESDCVEELGKRQRNNTILFLYGKSRDHSGDDPECKKDKREGSDFKVNRVFQKVFKRLYLEIIALSYVPVAIFFS